MIPKLIVAAAAALLLCLPAQAQQKPKFGHFDSGALIESLPELKNVQKFLEQEQAKQEAQLTALQEDFSKQIQDYQAKQSSMTEDERIAKEAELQDMQQRIVTFRQTAIQDLQKKQQELIAPISQKVLMAVQQVGVDNGFLYIFEHKAGFILATGSQSIDVAPLVKKQLGIQ